MKASIESVVAPFSAHRMVRDYVMNAYIPAADTHKG
jgi:glucan phosphorylase